MTSQHKDLTISNYDYIHAFIIQCLSLRKSNFQLHHFLFVTHKTIVLGQVFVMMELTVIISKIKTMIFVISKQI
jgi:hypothetical protein